MTLPSPSFIHCLHRLFTLHHRWCLPCTPLISRKAPGYSTLKTPSVEFITDGHELEYSSLTAFFIEWSQVSQSSSVWSGPRPRSWLLSQIQIGDRLLQVPGSPGVNSSIFSVLISNFNNHLESHHPNCTKPHSIQETFSHTKKVMTITLIP